MTKEFDFVINRRAEIEITDDIAAWEDWAVQDGVMPLTVAFAHQNPHIVFSDGVPDKQGPWCTPRSPVMVDRLLKAKASRNNGAVPDDPATQEAVRGIMGEGEAAQYFAFVRLEREMPKYERIVADPMHVKVPEKPDAKMLICYNLAHRVSKQDAPSVVKYVERFEKEFGVTFAQAACKRDLTLVTTPAFVKWSIENASLMAAIALIPRGGGNTPPRSFTQRGNDVDPQCTEHPPSRTSAHSAVHRRQASAPKWFELRLELLRIRRAT